MAWVGRRCGLLRGRGCEPCHYREGECELLKGGGEPLVVSSPGFSPPCREPQDGSGNIGGWVYKHLHTFSAADPHDGLKPNLSGKVSPGARHHKT